MSSSLKDRPFLFDTQYNNDSVQPFLKWAGGKRQLLPFIKKYLPNNFTNYFEPFLGAGALLFYLKPKNAVVSDVNSELINCYEVIRDLCFDLLEDLKKHQNTKEYFYKIRSLDRKKEFNKLSNVERASRIIYLNKTCYNGLFRVNKQGQFNVPFGGYKKPNYLNSEIIKSINFYLNSNNIRILNSDFFQAVETAQRGDFIYLDPPYDPISETSSFTGYSLNAFDRSEQKRLKECFDNLTMKGCLVMLSNSSTDFIADLYSDYHIIRATANRNINSVGSDREKIDEFLILNYIPNNNTF